jgi:hypothetical protein
MRAGHPVATILLALGLTGVMSGCDAVQGASDAANSVNDTANKVQLCLEAVRLAGFNPDLSNPQQAVEDAHKKADELSKLAEKSGDTTVKQAIEGLSNSMSKVTVSDLSPQSAANWLQEKTDQLNALNTACGN